MNKEEKLYRTLLCFVVTSCIIGSLVMFFLM